ncbi:hypothetical protein BDK92_3883 [Micromonospora pisi]|uniref:Uncharacterized protein n=1 Tax=Micromonospora pisi TaxID=589240 RepID=A0A495JNB3_9ACTN|nr:hypothetical protein BDK92_3883 [Micromonospora pisi]
MWALAAAASITEADGLQIPAGFHKRPHAMDARRRIAYRTSLLVLILSRFNGKAAKLENVHLFMWATRTKRTRRMLSAWWAGRRFATAQLHRIDPDLLVTVRLAIADGLVGVKGQGRQRVYLSEKGVDLASAIDQEEELLATEKSFLASFPRLSDAAVARLLGVGAE